MQQSFNMEQGNISHTHTHTLSLSLYFSFSPIPQQNNISQKPPSANTQIYLICATRHSQHGDRESQEHACHRRRHEVGKQGNEDTIQEDQPGQN